MRPPIGHSWFYLISCSRLSNTLELKNSLIVIFNPSQIFFIVDIVVLKFLPLVILLSVDCVTPLIVPNLFMVICLSSQSYFQAFFKKFVGYMPKEFKKKKFNV